MKNVFLSLIGFIVIVITMSSFSNISNDNGDEPNVACDFFDPNCINMQYGIEYKVVGGKIPQMKIFSLKTGEYYLCHPEDFHEIVAQDEEFLLSRYKEIVKD